jgi:hypothetical protein
MMGSTVFLGAVDAEFKVTNQENLVIVEGGKTKDDAPANITFKIRVVDVVDPKTREPMLTKKGKRVTTLTLELADTSDDVRPPKPAMSDHQANALQAFLDWLIDNETKAMPVETWPAAMKNRGIDRRRAPEILAALDRKGLVRIENEKIYVGRSVG